MHHLLKNPFIFDADTVEANQGGYYLNFSKLFGKTDLYRYSFRCPHPRIKSQSCKEYLGNYFDGTIFPPKEMHVLNDVDIPEEGVVVDTELRQVGQDKPLVSVGTL